MTDKRDETGECADGHANAVAFDVLNFIIEESRAIRRDMAGNVWSRDGLAYRMMIIECLAQTGIDAECDRRFEFSTEGIDPTDFESDSRLDSEMSEAEIESFWAE